MKIKDLKNAIKDLKDEEEILAYLGQGHFSTLESINRKPVSLVRWNNTGRLSFSASDNFENQHGEIESEKEMSFFVLKDFVAKEVP